MSDAKRECRCETCGAWQSTANGAGECRRRAPTGDGMFLETWSHGWCYEWVPPPARQCPSPGSERTRRVLLELAAAVARVQPPCQDTAVRLIHEAADREDTP